MSFIHRFTVNDDFFIYDVNTNAIIEVDELVYSICPYFNKLDIEQIKKLFQNKFPLTSIQNAWNTIIKFSKEKGHFSDIHSINKNDTFEWDHMANEINLKLRQIVLNVTDNCNLRCRYCPYTCTHLGKRSHQKKYMTQDVAKKSIDYLLEHSTEQKGFIAVGFYGGEPLLNFQLIKWCIKYISNIYTKDVPIIYSITTNGTLINKEVIEFLIKNNVVLFISLDGPKKIHDNHRIDMHGKGTFNRIIRNIEMIKNISHSYYKSNVRFSIVLTGGTDYQQLDDFFSNYALAVRISSLEDFGSKELSYLDIFQNPLKNFEEMRQKFIFAAVQNIFNGQSVQDKYLFVKNLFENSLRRIHRRYPCNNLILDPPGHSICIPGAHRIFVSTNGLFYTCEKTEGNDNMLIGDIDNGVDIDLIRKTIQKYHDFIHAYCNGCWLIRMCSSCFVHAVSNNHFNTEKFIQNCQIRKKVFHEALRMYVEIGKENSSAFDWLERDPLDFLLEDKLNIA
jgi:uncharacterized protein